MGVDWQRVAFNNAYQATADGQSLAHMLSQTGESQSGDPRYRSATIQGFNTWNADNPKTVSSSKPKAAPVPAPSSSPSQPSAPAKPKEPAKWTNPENYMTPETKVETHMERYTSEDSPMTIGAITQAKRAQNSMGLLNTQGTIISTENNVNLTAIPLAQADADRNMQAALQSMAQDFQHDITKMQLDSAEKQALAASFTTMVNTQIAAAGRVMATEGATWTQTMQDDMEGMINSSKSWLSGLYQVPLA